MKVGIKHKSTMIYKEASEIEVADGVTLMDLLNEQKLIKNIFSDLINEVQDSYIVKKDTPYIIQLGDRLERINELVLAEDMDTKMPLSMYEKIEDGKLILNKKKVGAL